MVTRPTSMPERDGAKALAVVGIGMSAWHAGLNAADFARCGAYRNTAPRGSEDVPTR